MSRQGRQLARGARATAIAWTLGALALFASVGVAHEGHDHGEAPPATAPAVGSPRVAATSERYQLVGIVEGEVLVIYLDRADDNSPVTAATLEVSLDGEPHKAELHERTATYEVTAPLLRKPGQYEVLVTIAEGETHDLLVGTLTIPAASARAAAVAPRLRETLAEAVKALAEGRRAIAFAGLV